MQKENTENKNGIRSKLNVGAGLLSASKDSPEREERPLTRKQERAISELLNPENKNIERVAEKAGVRTQTLRAWFYESEFQERLRDERERLFGEAMLSLKSYFNRAVDVLGEILNSGSEGAKLRACQMILDYGGAKETEKKPRKSEPEQESISFEELIEKLKKELWGMR